MNKLLKLILTVALACAMPLVFNSCSDDKDPEAPTVDVKFLPVKIEITDTDGEYATFDLVYNDNNQLIKYTDKDYPEDEKTFHYNDKNQLTSITHIEGSTYTYEYDEEAGTISSKNGEERDNIVYKVDKNGLPISSVNPIEKGTSTYEFDKFNNLVKEIELRNEKLANTTTSTYYEVNSPFAHMLLPAWFMLEDDYFGIQTTGLHMTKVKGYTSTTSSETSTFTIVKEQNNFPTIVKEVVTYKDGDGKESITEYTHTITYKEVK